MFSYRPNPAAVGSHVASSGTAISSARPTIMMITNGAAPRTIVASGAFEMPLITKRFMPTGGVIMASSRLIINKMPYQIGSMPRAIIVGSRIGVVIRMIAMDSSEPPHLNWSSAMFRKRRTDNDEQTTEAGRDYH